VTRATLLQLLAHPTALNGADVRALEQLADTFPYCQTAHLLLAKAAHDQGSMLAGQRLRRAATYAADRTYLRQLIELPVPATGLVAASAATPPSQAEPAFAVSEVPDASLASSETTEQQAVASLEDKSDQDIVQAEASDALPAEAAAEPAPVEATALPKPISFSEVIQLPAATELSAPVAPLEAELPTTTNSVELTPLLQAELPAEEGVVTQEKESQEEELPVQAPPIRPPAEAATARFEFGLAEQEPAEITAYRLPELADSIVPVSKVVIPLTPRLPVFRGLQEVCYTPEEGSRLGFCLVAAATAELLPGTSLPPAGEFFAPDALVLAHLAAHQLPSEPKPSTISLIDSFLQRAPATNRRRQLPLPTTTEPEAQADLSVRSTRAEPDLASESLAKILVRQGKTDRAIAVYERLMVKHPEKIAYFAAQIESLRPSA
jgi:hypothetical protein